jgi:UDP-N-acetylenolpyruvoylglucosamine reductase
MGGATFDVVESVRLMDYAGEIREYTKDEMPVEYRCCPLLKNHIALNVVFKCVRASREEVEKRMKAFSKKRWETQPAAPSAGCIFKNPEKIPAGRLVDELGLKGTRVGGAAVSAEHGNFIVNDGNATARDILELVEILKQRVKKEREIDLQTEIEIIGEN